MITLLYIKMKEKKITLICLKILLFLKNKRKNEKKIKIPAFIRIDSEAAVKNPKRQS